MTREEEEEEARESRHGKGKNRQTEGKWGGQHNTGNINRECASTTKQSSSKAAKQPSSQAAKQPSSSAAKQQRG
jgi:hypothetical protein